jgi:hypothetical protein
MFTAMWVVCFIGQGCVEIEEEKPSVFKESAACEQHAERQAKDLLERLAARGVVAEIGYKCDRMRDA